MLFYKCKTHKIVLYLIPFGFKVKKKNLIGAKLHNKNIYNHVWCTIIDTPKFWNQLKDSFPAWAASMGSIRYIWKWWSCMVIYVGMCHSNGKEHSDALFNTVTSAEILRYLHFFTNYLTVNLHLPWNWIMSAKMVRNCQYWSVSEIDNFVYGVIQFHIDVIDN